MGLTRCGGVDVGTRPPPRADAPPAAPGAGLLVQALPGAGKGEALSFPPAVTGRRDRGGLPSEYGAQAAVEAPFGVEWPSLSDEVVISGKTLRVGFNRAMEGARAGAPAGGHVTIAPAVIGLATWESDRVLAFTAEGFFDPAVDYDVTLTGVASAAGEKLADQRFKLRSTTGAVIAGKEVGHVPKLGAPRVVALAPNEGMVHPRARFQVLYDQPVSLAQAKQLVALYREGDATPLPLSLSHAAADSFLGVRVARRFVVVATPLAPLERGWRYRLDAADHASVATTTRELVADVAESFELSGVECDYYRSEGDVCAVDGSTVRTNKGEIHLRFNNHVGLDERRLRAAVQVTPFVRNLAVQNAGWHGDGRIIVTGDFRPSVRYQLRANGLRDHLGQALALPVEVVVAMQPLGASVTMPEGLLTLDEEHTQRFEIMSRNVAEAQLSFWRVDEGDVDAFKSALAQASEGVVETRMADVVVDVTVDAKRDELMGTEVDLSQLLTSDASWLGTIAIKKLAHGASAQSYAASAAAARAPVALVKPGNADSLAVHVHSAPGATLVHVARLGSGEPVAGAGVALSSLAGHSVATDADGVAVIDTSTLDGDSDEVITVSDASEKVVVPLSRTIGSAAEWFPDLARAGHPGDAPPLERVVLMTDRGIYRPGSTLRIKGTLFEPDGADLRPLAGKPVHLRVTGPTGTEVCRAALSSSDMGSVHSSCKLPESAELGLHTVALVNRETDHVYDSTTVRVAEFELPRFKVDVEGAVDGDRFRGKVRGKYLFGASMGGASAEWHLTRHEEPFPAGALTDAGLVFRAERRWYDAEPARWVQTGESALDGQGELAIDQAVALGGSEGPQRFTLEADVADKSYRHVAGRTSVVMHPADTYAGVKLATDYAEVGSALDVELGVIDQQGRAVAGERVSARLLRVEWRYQRRRGPGGAGDDEYRKTETEVARCSTTSALTAVGCRLTVPRSGDFRVVASVAGRDGGSRALWAYRDGEASSGKIPEQGRVVQVSTDKARYAPGDRARVVARNPFGKATAILTVELGGLASHQHKRVEGAAAVFDVPIDARHAPQVHATVTLLPIGAEGAARAAFRVGAATLPVKLGGAALEVAVASDKASYGPGDTAEIKVTVTDGGAAEANAEVALAIVDEGVLRLTGHRPPDVVAAMRPPIALAFTVRDTRGSLAELFGRSHVAGDGGADALGMPPDTRRKFVETALWKPALRTDATGQATVRVKLPDNLTEFRMMAVAIDKEGKGGAEEASFLVQKPVLLEPVLPRFAHVGDALEIAAMVHNTTAQPLDATVRIEGESTAVTIPAGGHARVGKTISPSQPGLRRLGMVVLDPSGAVLDAVEEDLKVAQAGVDVRPLLAGAFAGEQRVAIAIPASAELEPGAALTIRLGEDMWPELAERVEYLLDYPHGCVEQTTSSTLPLLAAREIFPRIGVSHHPEAFFEERIVAGLERLATMRTPSGGLGYWPGDPQPNLFGTAYAIRAFVLAKAIGVDPRPDVREGMQRYLGEQLRRDATPIRERAVIAQSLAELGALPPGIMDTLYARRDEMDLFARASLALALGASDRTRDRLDVVLAELEEGLGGDGIAEWSADYGWYGSAARTRAQVATALTRHRRHSAKLPGLVRELAGSTGGYTTQSTAFALLALADHLKGMKGTPGSSVGATLDGAELPVARTLDGGREYHIPLAELRGKKAELVLRGGAEQVIGFALRAAYREAITAAGDTLVAATAESGPEVYRVYTRPDGSAVDLEQLTAGELLRVALLVRMPTGPDIKRGYLAITDRLPAGFEAVQPDLATVASAPELGSAHPLANLLAYPQSTASHVEMRDDRVQLYFDRVSDYARDVAATYLVRVTTPGTFALPPAMAELMYQPDSLSYSEGGKVAIR
jgi:hypothetical protein